MKTNNIEIEYKKNSKRKMTFITMTSNLEIDNNQNNNIVNNEFQNKNINNFQNIKLE